MVVLTPALYGMMGGIFGGNGRNIYRYNTRLLPPNPHHPKKLNRFETGFYYHLGGYRGARADIAKLTFPCLIPSTQHGFVLYWIFRTLVMYM